MTLSEEEINVAFDLALRAATVAASIINSAMDSKGAHLDIQTKSSTVDLVTKYDKKCEEDVLNILHHGTPNYEILSEETNSGTLLTDSPTWVVDPIDGTTSFVHGLYDCCVSIALVVNKEPIIGVVSAPRLQEVFTAIKGRGAFCNGQRIRVSPTKVLNKALVLSHQAYNRSEKCVKSTIAIQRELVDIPVHSIRNNGSAALDMCMVASGRAEVYFEVGIQAWDYAAGTIIVREAGGIVHSPDNLETFSLMERGMCCSNSSEISSPIVDLVKKYGYKEAVLG